MCKQPSPPSTNITGEGQAAQPTWSHYEWWWLWWGGGGPLSTNILQVGVKQAQINIPPPGHITSEGQAAQSTKHKHYRWRASSPAHQAQTLLVGGRGFIVHWNGLIQPVLIKEEHGLIIGLVASASRSPEVIGGMSGAHLDQGCG